MNYIHKIFAIIMAGLMACSVQAMDNEESEAMRSCCNSNNKFDQVLELVCEVNEDITGIFTALENIDIKLNVNLTINVTIDLAEVFTALAFGFYDTQTIICQKFEQTWTILQKIDDDVTGVFTAINALEDISGIFTALEFGFYDTQTIICEKFEQTWTIIAPVAAALCSPQEILQANIGVTTYTISQPGFYVFAENIVFSPASAQPALEITSNNVTIDMCGKTLTQGNAVAGVDGIRAPGNTTAAPRSNVTIMNGAISGFTRSGIVVGTNPVTPANTAARFVTIKNMKIFNCSSVGVEFVSSSSIAQATLENLELFSNQIGASLTNVIAGSIKSCDMTLNTTGLRLNQSSDIVIKKCKAHKNTQAGFWLQNASNNTLTKCFAIKNGQGGSTNAYGFIAQGGYANVFEECIAEGTLSNATGDDNVAAGFALTSTEMFSKIINCESLTNTTVSGFAIPYGILLTNTFPATGLTLTVSARSFTNTLYTNNSWSPNGKYLASSPASPTTNLLIAEFDSVARTLNPYFTDPLVLTSTVNTIAWSPDGRYVAIGTSAGDVSTYLLDVAGHLLTLIDTQNTTGAVNSVSWSPNGQYLLVGHNLAGGFDFRIYRSNGGVLSLVLSSALGLGANSVDWRDNLTFAVGGVISAGVSIRAYSFNPMTNIATSLSSASPGIDIQEVRWASDKCYLAASGSGVGTNIFVYPFSGTSLGTPATATFGDTANFLVWSPDGKYIAIGGVTPQGVKVYRFSRTLFSLSFQSSVPASGDVIGLDWSPSGEFLSVSYSTGSFINLNFRIYNALEFTAAKNIIKNNVVYCSNGDSLPSGIGISGSSLSNLIIGNTAYENEFDYEFVTNVFNSGINGSPSILENVSVPPY